MFHREEKLTSTNTTDRDYISEKTDTKAIATPLPSKDFNLDDDDRYLTLDIVTRWSRTLYTTKHKEHVVFFSEFSY